jgi:predicted flap endonuclease-1-like 5' DNA nuclease
VEQGDDLASIPGLGPAYARLLKESGVLTYEDLARLDEPDLRTLVRARPSWEGVNVGAWITEARRRAGLEEAVSVVEIPEPQGPVPTAEVAPVRETPEEASEGAVRDDLTKIKGIGPTYAKKLHAAGIYNFKGLAALSVDELSNIIQPQSWQKVNLNNWIEQARALTTRE